MCEWACVCGACRVYDSLFEGHMDGSVTGHVGLVQTSISNAKRPWEFGPTLHANVSAIALQLLRAARRAAGEPEEPEGMRFSDPNAVGAICKPSYTGKVTELHQDEGYYDPAFDYSCSRVMVWLPLVDVDEAGGCMHFISGSHRRPEQVLAHRPAPNQTMNPLTSLGFNELEVATGSEVDSWANSTPAPLPAGGAAFWLPRTLHGSARNSSPTPRKALLMSASCDPTPLAQPFSRPWRAEVRAGQTGQQPLAGSEEALGGAGSRRRRPEDETGLDPNGAAAAASGPKFWCASASPTPLLPSGSHEGSPVICANAPVGAMMLGLRRRQRPLRQRG